jgi:hypothetical protein
MMELMKILYGNDEVKDDSNKTGSTQGICGANSSSGLVEISSEAEEVLLEE